MLKKIISGGQTGVDQGALDAAIKMGILYGSWIPKCRMTENSSIPDNYNLLKMPTAIYAKRTEKNVIDSGGTLIFSHGKLTGGSKLTRHLAIKYDRPCLHIDLNRTSAFEAALIITHWIVKENIEVLNVAGSRASKDPKIYQKTKEILECVIELSMAYRHKPGLDGQNQRQKIAAPDTVDGAVDCMLRELPLKDKMVMANMTLDEIEGLYSRTGSYFEIILEPWLVNPNLLESCKLISGKRDISKGDEVARIILEALWIKLKKAYKLRIVK